MPVRKYIRLFLLYFLVMCSWPKTVQATNDPPPDCVYKVGVVPQFEQRRIFEVWSGVLDALKAETGCHFELIGSPNIIEFEKAFKSGVYDFAYMNPYHAVMAQKTQGYIPLVRSNNKKLTGILVVKKDSPIQDITALDGQNVAFPSPNALGASLLMRAELATGHDVNVVPKYVKTHSSVYLHVAKGLTVAGGGVVRTLSEQPDYVKKALRVLYTTTPINAHPLVVHPRITDDFKIKTQSAWLNLADKKPELFDQIPMQNPVATTYEDYKSLEDLGLENFIGTDD